MFEICFEKIFTLELEFVKITKGNKSLVLMKEKEG